MERTAKSGHLEVVKLLYDMGATCTSTAIHLAQVHGHHDVYRFLNASCPGKVFNSLRKQICLFPGCHPKPWYVAIAKRVLYYCQEYKRGMCSPGKGVITERLKYIGEVPTGGMLALKNNYLNRGHFLISTVAFFLLIVHHFIKYWVFG